MAGLRLSPGRRDHENRLSAPPETSQRSVSVPTNLIPGGDMSTLNTDPFSVGVGVRGNPQLPRPFSEMPFARDAESPPVRSRASTGMMNSGIGPGKHHDDFVMDTNSSSIASKRSVEKFYQSGEPEYFRFFVNKFKRRSPLINRGYWLRMKAVEHAVSRFLSEQTSKTKLVVNLGCGYDPLPFQFLGKQRELCENSLFVDVDYPALMRNKVNIIGNAEALTSLIPDVTMTDAETGLLATSLSYAAVGCDLRDLDTLRAILQENFQVETSQVAIMFVAEVSIAYMEKADSQAVIEWAATYNDVRFTVLEQQVPDGQDHPFAMTMLSHFNKLRTPLYALGTLDQMKARFVKGGWPGAAMEAHSLWELWSEPSFLGPELRRWLDTVEPFDEWEEFAIYASHYFLLVAERKADQDYKFVAPRASLVANRNTILGSPLSPASPALDPTDTDPANVLIAQELPTSHVPRRFAAIAPSASRAQDGDAFGLHGGQGTQERRDDCDTYSWFDTAQLVDGPPLRSGLLCHTITRLGGTNNCMLAGGRTSPDKALADCWLRQDGIWQKVADLPEGRYRHCGVPIRLPTEPRPAHTVLLYGGRASDGHVLDEWLLWTGEQGWQNLRVVGDHPCARFGSAMITDKSEGISGIIVGGLTSAGRVLNDFWHWNLQPDMSVTCQNVTARANNVLKANIWILGRFGAQLVRSEQGILLVGGITGGRLLSRNEQILNMRTLRTTPVRGARQLYVGCSIQNVDGGILILGGGATCFSFGTFWNKGCLLAQPTQRRDEMTWQLVSGTTSSGMDPSIAEPKTLIIPPDALRSPDRNAKDTTPVEATPVANSEKMLEPIDTTVLPSIARVPDVDLDDDMVAAVLSAGAVGAENNTASFASPLRPTIEVTQNGVPSPLRSPIKSPSKSPSTSPRIHANDAESRYTTALPSPLSVPNLQVHDRVVTYNSTLPARWTVPRVQLTNNSAFKRCLDAAQPVIITGTSFGRCTQYWSDEYLKEAVGNNRQVVVHSSTEEKMDFQTKNFNYVTQSFGEFIDSAAKGGRLYLRSLSQEQPGRKPTSLAEDFPELADDFELAGEFAYVLNNLHSTPLRISGPVTMWLHYDVMDNVLCQIRGRKRVVLFPPSDVSKLGFGPGASSSSVNVFDPLSTSTNTSSLAQTHPHEAILEPGDALLIPSTWAHTAAPTGGMSVAVNCFFRGLGNDSYAAGRDVYGNRDLASYERGRNDIAKIIKSFDNLPAHVSGFYMERLAMELLEKAHTVSKSAGGGGADRLHSVYAELG